MEMYHLSHLFIDVLLPVQDAAKHKEPRTKCCQKRRNNLCKNDIDAFGLIDNNHQNKDTHRMNDTQFPSDTRIIQLEVLPEDEQERDIADLDQVGRSLFDQLANDGYSVKPVAKRSYYRAD